MSNSATARRARRGYCSGNDSTRASRAGNVAAALVPPFLHMTGMALLMVLVVQGWSTQGNVGGGVRW